MDLASAQRLFATLAALLGIAASADAIVYDEAIDGPLPTHSNPTHSIGPQLPEFLTLDPGVNVFTGTVTWGDDTQFDTVPMTLLPIGWSITSITLTVSNIRTSGSGTLCCVGAQLLTYDPAVTRIVRSVPASTSGNGLLSVPFSNLSLFQNVLPESDHGRYGLGLGGYAGALTDGVPISFDYTWTVTLTMDAEPVPVLPSVGWVALALALGASARSHVARAPRARPSA